MTQNQIAWYAARENKRSHLANEKLTAQGQFEQARHNAAQEAIDVYKSDNSYRASIYGSDSARAASMYAANAAADASRYSADKHYQSSVYSADKAYQASTYATDVKHFDTLLTLDSQERRNIRDNKVKWYSTVLSEGNKRDISDKDRLSRENIALKDRQAEVAMNTWDNLTSLTTATISAGSRIGSTVISSLADIVSIL